MTCPRCGARNTPRATWCTICLAPLAPATGTPEPAGEAVSEVADLAPHAGPGERGFRTRDGEVEWRCPNCASWNALVVPVCAVCGSPVPGTRATRSWTPDRVARTRRVLWVAAAVICLLVLLAVVVGVLGSPGG